MGRKNTLSVFSKRDYFKIKKQHAEVGWRNEKILVNLFQQRQKNRHLSRYICFHFTAGREIQCWMANFLCAVTWRTHGGTREHEDTCCISPIVCLLQWRRTGIITRFSDDKMTSIISDNFSVINTRWLQEMTASSSHKNKKNMLHLHSSEFY